jgi:cell wall-associated NlpC family hydrolase
LVGQRVSRENLEFGDLVFFHTYSRKFVSHVGIYLSDNLFAHASSRLGVTISSLNSTYYNTRYVAGRRLSSKDLLTLKTAKNEQLD